MALSAIGDELWFVDLQNDDPARNSRVWRTLERWNGILAPEGGAPRDWRLTVRDRAAARASL